MTIGLISGILGIILSGLAIYEILSTKKTVSALTNNDLKHVKDDLKELIKDFKDNKLRVWDKYNELENKIEKIGHSVGVLEGKLNNK